MDQELVKNGLTTSQAQKRLQQYGPNKLAGRKRFSAFKLLFSQFTSPLIYVLLLAAGVTLFLRDWADTLVILLAVGVNTILGFYQEYKAAKGLEALAAMLQPKAEVIRDGRRQEVPIETLVPGDLVRLGMGVTIPADGILVKAKDLSVNEAILTGESESVDKQALSSRQLRQVSDTGKPGHRTVPGKMAAEFKEDLGVFMGTDVVTGVGLMMVVSTGTQTKMGQIAHSLAAQEEEQTPLQKKLADFSRLLAILVGVISLILLAVGLVSGTPFIEIFPTAVAVAVSAIPEGLVVALTAILALGMQRILKRKALVRKLVAAETLGGVTVICVDKTGTLTEGKMRVVKTDFVDQKLGVLGMLLCNDLRDPLEVAMWEWGEKQISNIKDQKAKIKTTEVLLAGYPRVASKPFSPESKLIVTLHDQLDKHERLLFVSGAPEVVLDRTVLSKKDKQVWLDRFAAYGKQGLRLVGFAAKPVPAKQSAVSYRDAVSLRWLGVALFEDPVRAGVANAFRTTQKAGIQVKVITGDYLETAKAVLGKLNLFTKELQPEQAILGDELEKLSTEALTQRVKEVVLFARTSPEQKLKIVQALQDQGEVVAMTGDGVNDAPALKKADVGIVVSSASDVSKGTADMVLLDDNFTTIVAAIEEGRGIFTNLRKVILYLLSDSFAEVLLVLGSLVLRLPLPILASQILWVNLIDDGLPSLALTLEPKEKGLMESPPRDPKVNLLDMEIKILIGLISGLAGLMSLGFFWWLWAKNDANLIFARTMVFTLLSVMTLIYVFSCRSLKVPIWKAKPWENPWLVLAVIFGLFLQLIALYVPFFQNFLETVPLGLREWSWIISASFPVIVAIESVKWAFLHSRRRR